MSEQILSLSIKSSEKESGDELGTPYAVHETQLLVKSLIKILKTTEEEKEDRRKYGGELLNRSWEWTVIFGLALKKTLH